MAGKSIQEVRVSTISPERVRELRERAPYSQQELADEAGVSLYTIQRIERGDGTVRARTVRGLAKALGVEVDELRGGAPKGAAPPAPQRSFNDELAAEERRAAVTELLSDRLDHAHLMRSLAETEQQVREMTLEELKVRGGELLDEQELVQKAFLDPRRYFPPQITANRQRLHALWAELQAVQHGFWPRAAALHRIWLTKVRLQHDMPREEIDEGLREMESFLAKAAAQEAQVPT
jgi:transcriptional regulator with XRE-family HTH domain